MVRRIEDKDCPQVRNRSHSGHRRLGGAEASCASSCIPTSAGCRHRGIQPHSDRRLDAGNQIETHREWRLVDFWRRIENWSVNRGNLLDPDKSLFRDTHGRGRSESHATGGRD